MNKNWLIGGLVAAVVIGGSIYYSIQVNKDADEGVVVTDHAMGNLDSEVVLVEYADYQCPACAQFNPEVQNTLEEYGDRLRYEYRHLPLIEIHPSTLAAAKAAEAAGQQGKFFEYSNLLFTKQNEWSKVPNPAPFFTRYAEELDLDISQFKRQQRSKILADKIMTERQEARDLGLTGTPSFLLNGEVMSMATFQEFRDQIAAAVGEDISVTEE